MAFDISMINEVYSKLSESISRVRRVVDCPLTLSEKILYSHLSSYDNFKPPFISF